MGKAEYLALLPRVYPGSRDFRPACMVSSDDTRMEIKRSWLSQGHEAIYGDNSVNHLKLSVKPEFDRAKADLPPFCGFSYSNDFPWEGGYWMEYFYYTSSVNYAFGFSVLTYPEDTPEREGEIAPKGSVSELAVPAFKVFSEGGNIYYSRALSYNYSIHGTPKRVPDNGWEIYPSQMFSDDEAWKWGEKVILYDNSSQSWNYYDGLQLLPRSIIRWPVIPYYWVDWALINKPTTDSDYEALSECFRNTVQEYTGSGMNNIANIAEIISLAKAIYSGDVSSLFSSFKEWADSLTVSADQYAKLKKYGVTDNVPKISQLIKKYGSSFVRKVLPDVWLKYRYMYNTTKADAEAAVDYAIKKKFSYLQGDEVLRGNIGISLGTLSLKMRLENTMDIGRNVKKSIQDAGLFPDLVTLWDLVPFSFVVDWASPEFGSALEDLSQREWSETYKVKELLVTHDEEWIMRYAGFNYHFSHYQRELLSECPQFEIYEDPDPHTKGKTIVKRIVDGVSLILSIGG